MAVRLLNSKGAKRLLLLLCLSLLVLLVLAVYFPSYSRLRTLNNGNEDISRRNADLEQEIKDLEDKLQRVGKDPFLYESIARDELGVAKENEVVIDIKK
ncbi:MAG: septum formation initiator family protein [Candidatus Omnitrophica bacterium]|nr:septum formation initiator family protein [Candidatus Omnitrophota bacterium]